MLLKAPSPEYLNIFLFFGLAVFLSLIIICIPFVLASRNPNKAKNSAYECGFEPFSNARSQFDIKFYLVGMLFIIFDLEIAFLIPWAVELKNMSQFGFLSMMLFLLVLTIGFLYELANGALDW
jgi:NADH-quinone oxidoreductase subunit A